MSIYTAMCSRVLFPLHERFKGHASVAWRERLEESQWWSADQMGDYHARQLRDFLIDIGLRVPYYRDLFKERGFDPRSVRTTDALLGLPFLDKPAIRANVERLKADAHGPLTRYNTGGSSGEPLIFYMGKARKSHDVAAKWRATRWWDVDIGDREIVIWGSPIELSAQDRVRQVRDRLMRTRLLPAFEMSAANLDHFVETIRQFRPAMIFGYPSSISLIARHAEKRNQRMNDLGIKVAFVTSERLYDYQRDDITRVFGCSVANGYGGRDAGFMAHECPHGGMHVSAEDIIVEIVGKDGNRLPFGEAGEVVITHLATTDFPFVRYRTGDVAVMSEKACSCGRSLPLLEEIQGRTTDFVVAADGTIMHGLAIIYPIRDIPGIAAFKVVQETRERVVVQIVPGEGCGAQVEANIVEGIKARLGQGVDVLVQRVSEISREKSGKFRYIVSHVKVD